MAPRWRVILRPKHHVGERASGRRRWRNGLERQVATRQ